MNTLIATMIIKTCFTPSQDCTHEIISEINNAKSSVYVQAYSFTSETIADALINAQQRGVRVILLLDKSQNSHNKNSMYNYFIYNGVPVLIDYKPRIAHNKVMIIDEKETITGSFNFTNAAQYNNAENVVFINDKEVAKEFYNNWSKRSLVSKKDY
jgi:phosphatidylserine/phosphatidylglycerophosphate/cardiolipin synthase-like enzyme